MAAVDMVGSPQSDEAGKGRMTTSKLSTQELLANLVDQVAQDGTRALGALDFLRNIAANTCRMGIIPTSKAMNHSGAAVAGVTLVRCPGPDSRIVVLDMFVSLNDVAILTFIDQFGVAVLPTFYGPNAGQGFSRSSQYGLWLPKGRDLAYSCSGAILHSVEVSYFIEG